MATKLIPAILGAVLLSCGISFAQAQELDVQASLNPTYDDGVVAHGLLVLEIQNRSATELDDIQIRLKGANIDLGGNRVLQMDALPPSGSAIVLETYTCASGSEMSPLPLQIAFSDNGGRRESTLVTQPRVLELWEE